MIGSGGDNSVEPITPDRFGYTKEQVIPWASTERKKVRMGLTHTSTVYCETSPVGTLPRPILMPFIECIHSPYAASSLPSVSSVRVHQDRQEGDSASALQDAAPLLAREALLLSVRSLPTLQDRCAMEGEPAFVPAAIAGGGERNTAVPILQ